MIKRFLLLSVLLTMCLAAMSQKYFHFGEVKVERTKTSYAELYRLIKTQNNDTSIRRISISNLDVRFTTPEDSIFGRNLNGEIAIDTMPYFDQFSTDNAAFVFNKNLIFDNCKFNDLGIAFHNCKFNKLVEFINCECSNKVSFHKSEIEKIRLQLNDFHLFSINATTVNHSAQFYFNKIVELEIQNSTFNEHKSKETWFDQNVSFPSINIDEHTGSVIYFEENQFLNYTPDSIWNPTTFISSSDIQHLNIIESTCDGIELSKLNVSVSVHIQSVEFGKGLLLKSVSLPEFRTSIEWEQLSNGRLLTERFKDVIGKNSEKVFNSRIAFKNLMANYSILYNLYKVRNDLESANSCFAEMKIMETKAIGNIYRNRGGFEWFFRWRLNQFLNYFTDYGTNPAKAVIKSAWVILIFAIFYLFFPSDWDVSNRSQLLSKVKDLASKNRKKSFIATLAFVLYSGLIHVLNALTLSLNAFTTLGFGDIPTHGAARYVTIVQGFIGWFLLTIFSVSLINQVLG